MLEVVLTFGLLLLPLILSAGAVLCWYRSLSRPTLYAVASALSLIGLQFLLREALSPLVFTQFVGGEAGGVSAQEQRDSIVPFLQWQVPVAVATIALGVPFLWWLKLALRKG